MIKYSIVIPVYNTAKYISKCLDSIMIQDYDNYEVVIINDGSTDESLVEVQKYVDKIKNIKILSQENSGVSSARNIGIKEAVGKYILFIDSDDYIEKTYINTINRVMENQKYVAVFNDLIRDTPQGFTFTHVSNSFFTDEISIEKGIEYCIDDSKYGGAPHNRVFERKILIENNIFFNTDIDYGEDLLFNVEYLLSFIENKDSRMIKLISEPTYHYLQREGSAVSSFNKKSLTLVKASSALVDKTKILNDNIRQIMLRRAISRTSRAYVRANQKGYSIIHLEKDFSRFLKPSLRSITLLIGGTENRKIKVMDVCLYCLASFCFNILRIK